MKKILIVDDDPDILALVENRLKMNNYEVIVANEGKAGINKAIADKPDLIIMDVMMPQMNGGEAVKLLKANPATMEIPVLFFTAMLSYSPESDIDRINVSGQFYPAIKKPFDPNKFLSAVKLLLSQKP